MNAPQLLHVPTTGETGPKLRESHPREWVDRSGPAYKRRPLACFSNPTHGSGWIVQVQPTNEGRSPASRIPPTGVGGSFKSSLNRSGPGFSCFVSFLSSRAARERDKRAKNGSAL